MDSERYQQINQLLDAALEMNPDERPAFLERECGNDQELRRQITLMLEAHDLGDCFLDKPVIEPLFKDIGVSETDSIIGRTLGNYRIESLLGKGGMGEVYQAQDLRLGRRVALKMLPIESDGDDGSRRRFLREAQSASTLNHPNIATIYSIESVENREMIVMELVSGETLKAEIERGRVWFGRLIEIALQVSDAIAAAHASGVIHRDLKPANIMITREGQVKVVDFGLAKRIPAQSGADFQTDSLTGSGQILGTVTYMSPEQARGEELDARSDIFSLGCVLYEAATGRRPFQGPTPLATIHQIISAAPARPGAINPELSPDFDKLILRMLAKNREDRFESATVLKRELLSLKKSGSGRETASKTAYPARGAAAGDYGWVALPTSDQSAMGPREHPENRKTGSR